MKKINALGLPLFGVVLALLIGELVARSTYTKPWYVRLVEEVRVNKGWLAKIHLNRFGLRDKDYSAIKPPDTRRVLILSDSFTFGDGVPDDAVTARLLERDLNAGAGSERVEVMNGGISGSLTNDWVDLLKNVSGEFQPDVILVVFFLRDGTLTTSMGTFFRPIRNQIVVQNAASALYGHSYLYRMYKDRADRRTISQAYTKAINDSYAGDPEQTAEWRSAQSNLHELKSIAADIHARIGLVIFPVLADLNANYPFSPTMDAVTAFAAHEQIPTLSLLPAFMGENGPDLWVSPYDQHPNELGHKIAADAILPFLRKLVTEP